MLRALIWLGVLGGISFVVYAWATGGSTPLVNPKNIISLGPGRAEAEKGGKDPGRPEPNPRRDANPRVSEPRSRNPGEAKAVAVHAAPRLSDPLVVPGARVNVIFTQTVSSQRQGQVLFLGKEVTGSARVPTDTNKQEKNLDFITVQIPFLAVETTPSEVERLKVMGFQARDKLWRRWQDNDTLEPGKVIVLTEKKTFERLDKDMRVQEGELLGLVDPSIARDDTIIKIAKLQASESEWRASEKTRDEAKKRYETLLELRKNGNGVAAEELRGALLTYERYIEDSKAKFHGVDVARSELRQAQSILKLHAIRAAISGAITDVYKHRGEAVKEQDPLFQIQNLDVIRAEGLVEIQDAKKLTTGMPVVVEPIQSVAPRLVLRGHREAVTAVAVSGKPVNIQGERYRHVVSASEDRTARVWAVRQEKDTWVGQERWTLEHPAAVRSVACSPAGAAHNLCLTGTEDGVGRIWDLDDPTKKPVLLENSHRGAINAVAFSADGKHCATASDDRTIRVWDAETGKLEHRTDAQRGAVTSVAFTPDNRLVSAGRDRSLIVWELGAEGRLNQVKEIPGLGGQVDTLGIFHKPGRGQGPTAETLALFDQGRQLRVLSLDDKSTRGVITSSTASVNFSTFALFSPDGRSVLTTGSSDNRLQLWRNPMFSSRGRAAELRQYIWNEAPTTCAAFAPPESGTPANTAGASPFVVTGTRNYQVVLWGLPTAEEMQDPGPNAVLTLVEKFLENTSRQVRISAKVIRKTPGLMPGSTATVVVYPR
jgi:WD40 repeat protein